MIKNLLYSLFLHFLLLLAIYANFNLKNIEENKSSEIAVSLIALDGSETSNNTKPSSEEKSEKKPETAAAKPSEEAKSEKKSPKNKVKEQPKKMAKSKPAKSLTEPIKEEKTAEFKQEQKPEEVQKETDKIKEDKEVNEHQDEEQNNASRKENDSGSKKKFEEEKEASDNKNAANNAGSMVNNLENIDLSAREKFNIQSQLKRCYARAIDETKLESNLKVLVKVKVSEEGYIDSDIDDTLNNERYNNPKETNYKIAIDNARRAIDLCSPLRNLPLDKYDIWKEVMLEFGKEE